MTESVTTAEPAAAEETIEQVASRIFADNAPANDAGAPIPANDVEAPPKADPVAERASARILANQRAEQRAAKVRAELAAERAAIEADKAAIAEAKALKEQLEAALLSPSKLLEFAKRTPKDFLEALATEHEPEAIARREAAGALTVVQKLEARIDAMEKAAAEKAAAGQQEARMRELAAQEQAVGAAFVEHVATNADKYPSLIEVMGPDEIVQAGFALLHEVLGKDANGRQVTRLDAWIAEHGDEPTDMDIAVALEERAQARAKARSEWRARIGKNAPGPTGNPSEDVRATQPERGPSPRTLTSRAASEKAAAAPAWSQEAADEESLRILRAALSG